MNLSDLIDRNNVRAKSFNDTEKMKQSLQNEYDKQLQLRENVN